MHYVLVLHKYTVFEVGIGVHGSDFIYNRKKYRFRLGLLYMCCVLYIYVDTYESERNITIFIVTINVQFI